VIGGVRGRGTQNRGGGSPRLSGTPAHSSINQCYICSNEAHRELLPAIHQKPLVWLVLTFPPAQVLLSNTTIRNAIDGNLEHPHLLLVADGYNHAP
jgi:hypothetical protein